MTDGGRMLVEPMRRMAEGKPPFEGNDELKPTTRDVRESIEWLADRGWGKPTQSVEHSGPEGEALVVQVLTYAGTVTPEDK